MRTLLASVLPFALLAPAVAQRQCFATHDDGTLVTNVSTGGVPIGYRLVAPSALRVNALQVHTGLQAGSATLAIWSHDAARNQPLAVRESASYGQHRIESWQGGVLSNPVALAAGEVFWVVWTAPNSSRTNWSTSTSGTVFYRGLIGGVWNGPANGWGPVAAKIRVYCEPQAGPVQSFGSGQAGTGGVVPTLQLEGWPSPGNALEFVLLAAAPATQALFLAGLPTNQVIPGLGTLYTQPLASAVVPTSPGRTPGVGEATLEIRSPADPNLVGALLGFQYWVVDSGATTGFAHTDGLTVTFQ